MEIPYTGNSNKNIRQTSEERLAVLRQCLLLFEKGWAVMRTEK